QGNRRTANCQVGAIGFTAATVRFTKKQIPEFSRIIREAAAELARAFQTHHQPPADNSTSSGAHAETSRTPLPLIS
ncbi:MAG: hypothetical protein MK299_10770, partial [Pseudomonadales bacterium]|nr:hypothetical protein [Pseudomonadales bacterium]